MLEDGYQNFDLMTINRRDYYLFNFSILSINWDPILLWIVFNVHRDLNNLNNYYLDSPIRKLKLFNDFATPLGTRSIDEDYTIWYPYNEAVVQRINDPKALTDKRVRVGKFYFPHGSSAWRECPHCGKLMMYMGEKWGYHSDSLMSPLPFENFSSNFYAKTEKEKVGYKNREYDIIECIFCGNKTTFKDTQMLIQTAFKGANPSFIEEIQRDMKISIEKAEHIILMGYSLPSDDIGYRSILASRCQKYIKDNPLKVSIVLFDSEAEDKWYEGETLEHYLKENSDVEAAKSIKGIKEVLGREIKIRVYLKGIPAVFLTGESVSKEKVLDLVYWHSEY